MYLPLATLSFLIYYMIKGRSKKCVEKFDLLVILIQLQAENAKYIF